jgi:hypothetical protein
MMHSGGGLDPVSQLPCLELASVVVLCRHLGRDFKEHVHFKFSTAQYRHSPPQTNEMISIKHYYLSSVGRRLNISESTRLPAAASCRHESCDRCASWTVQFQLQALDAEKFLDRTSTHHSSPAPNNKFAVRSAVSLPSPPIPLTSFAHSDRPDFVDHHTMFRTAMTRSAPALVRGVATMTPRPAGMRILRGGLAASSRMVRRGVVLPRVGAVQIVRSYSAGGALAKEEVEGRIMSLLAGFDKV